MKRKKSPRGKVQTPRANHQRWISQKSGQPPGSLQHVGLPKTDVVTFKITHYDATSLSTASTDINTLCALDLSQPGIFWIEVEGLCDTKVLGQLSRCFHLHPLVMEDVLNTAQRPKIDLHDGYAHLVAKHLEFSPATRAISQEQISLILGSNYVISFCEQPLSLMGQITKRLQDNYGQLRSSGADFLLYSLLDAVADQYFVVLDDLEEAAEALEYEMLNHPTADTLQALHHLKRQMLLVHKAVWPFREVTSVLGRGDTLLISSSNHIYVRDLYDHAVSVMDTTETLRDTLTSLVDLYLTTTSNRMNEIMKLLTMLSSIFIPLTFIAGIYGMNFPNMPEFNWAYSYPATLIVMALLALAMLIFFKIKKWW